MIPLLVHSHDKYYARLTAVPAQFVLDNLPAVKAILAKPRRLSVYELYEAVTGADACSVTLTEAEEKVLEHLEKWNGTED